MIRRPSSRSAAVLGACRRAGPARGLRVPRAAARRTGPGVPADEFNDSHFHLTNYIQQGIDVRQFLEIMGTRVGRSTLFGIPLQQQWSYAQLRRLRADLLPAERRAALLLLVHRRLHRQRLPIADAGRAGALRPDDHRLQPGRHVRRRSHPPRAARRSRRVHAASASSASTRSSSRRRSPARPPA